MKNLILAATLIFAVSCKKKEKTDPPPPTPGTASAMTPPPPDPGSGSAAVAPPATEFKEFISVFAEHAEKKPTDPVEVRFEKYTVKKATFDSKNIEGGTATIEVDLASLKSGSDKRDKHLTTADYIDTSKFTTMTIDIANVKKQDARYTADAKVKLRDIEKTYPITFEVVEAKDDWVRVKGEHKFPRMDFKVGKEKPGKDESVATDVTVKVQLTLKKT